MLDREITMERAQGIVLGTGVAYGPGLLPCITQNVADHRPELTESHQIELLCQFAGLNLIPLFHEVVGEVVYRFTHQRGETQVSPIPDKINGRVLSDIQRHSASLDAQLMDWLEVPLLLPGRPTRRSQVLALPGFPLDGWPMGNLKGERNTLAWLCTEAEENQAAQAATQAGRPARGYTATLAARHGYDPVIEAYRSLLACLNYCDRFKFVCRILLPAPHGLTPFARSAARSLPPTDEPTE